MNPHPAMKGELMINSQLHTASGDYTLDAAHTRIGFVARHAMVTKVRGSFDTFTGSVHLDLEQPSNSFASVSIEAVSINTHNGQRDSHLRTSDFLDAVTYPEIAFSSTKVEPLGADVYRVTGGLTIRGQTRTLTIDFTYHGAATDPSGNFRVGFEGGTTINRRDWGVAWNAPLEADGVLVSEKVTLEIEVSAIRTGLKA